MATESEVQAETNGNSVEHSEDYDKLIEYGINEKVAEKLEEIYTTGILKHSDLDDRALEALKEFPPEHGVDVLKQFCECNLEHVTNKSAYLCGYMKTYRMRMKQPGSGDAKPKGPDEAKIKEILDRTGYSLDVTTGQRKYGGPPPGAEDEEQPGKGHNHEVFCGKIPRDIFEDELIPQFEKAGKIWDLRLMMDPMTGNNRGYAFITYCDQESAKKAVEELNDFEIKPGKKLQVNLSIANVRLFVGNIPKCKSEEEIREEFTPHASGLEKVIIYSIPDDPKKKNRGFAFLEYESHKAASVAKRKLSSGRTKVWNCDIIVDWADPLEDPDEATMSKVKVLYVKNLKNDITDEQLKEKFSTYGEIERVKKIKDYGFVHFVEREHAVKALEELNNTMLGESMMEVSLAKPPGDNKKKEMRKREQQQRQMMYMMGGKGGFNDYNFPPRGGKFPPRGRGRGNYFNNYGPGPAFQGFGGYPGGYGPEPYYDDSFGGYEDDFYGGYGMPRRGRGGPGGMMRPPRGGPMRGRGGRGRGGRGMPPGPRGGPRGGARGGPAGPSTRGELTNGNGPNGISDLE
ncbi:unnamed protein product [Owenia fusiformis]|uniref:RRM domain-containing protein n=1 Tax=Owenia fusiformis TaxID=6347 RepID=A0A8S4PYF1_OWEFU|nr:unnamed protein product [Owenia fusiformis]